MSRTKSLQFKTSITEHVQIINDSKGRKMPAISLLWTPDAYNTIVHNTYKKNDETEFCITFTTLVKHHIDKESQKMVLNDGFGKKETRVISKNIRHAPEMVEFFEEYEQKGKANNKIMTHTIYDTPSNPDNSGFITLTFNGGFEEELKQNNSNIDDMQYLYIVNGLSPNKQSTGNQKSYPQTEFIFLEEDVDRYITFIKDVAKYYALLQEYNKEINSASEVLKNSLKQRLFAMKKRESSSKTAKVKSTSGDSKTDGKKKKKSTIQSKEEKKETGETSTVPKDGKKRPAEEDGEIVKSSTKKKQKIEETIENKKQELHRTDSQRKGKKIEGKKKSTKTSIVKIDLEIDGEKQTVGQDNDNAGKEETNASGDEDEYENEEDRSDGGSGNESEEEDEEEEEEEEEGEEGEDE